MGIPQRQLGDDEDVVVTVRPHGRVLFGPVLVLFVVAPITAVVAGFVGGGTVGTVLRWVVLGLGGLVVVRGSLVPFLLWRSTTYTVTTQRVALRRGVLHRFGRDVPLARVSGVTFRSTAWDRLFGSGRIRIDATGESPLVLDDVPAVEQVQRAVQKYAAAVFEEDEPVGFEDEDEVDGGLDDDVTGWPAPAPATGDQPTAVLRMPGPGPSGTALDVRGMFGDDARGEEPDDEPDDEMDDATYEEPDDAEYEDSEYEDSDHEPDDAAYEEPEEDDEPVDETTWRRRGRGGWGWRR